MPINSSITIILYSCLLSKIEEKITKKNMCVLPFIFTYLLSLVEYVISPWGLVLTFSVLSSEPEGILLRFPGAHFYS